MWERAVGVPPLRRLQSRDTFDATGLERVKLGVANEALLREAGQPAARGAYVWRWPIVKRPIPQGQVYAVLGKGGRPRLVASTGLENPADGIAPGDEASAIGGRGAIRTRPAGTAGRRYVYGVSSGEVSFTGVTSLSGKALKKAVRRLKLP
jgi:hypothetical protein